MSITQYPPAGGGGGTNYGDEVIDFLLTSPSASEVNTFFSDDKYAVELVNRFSGLAINQTVMDAVAASQTAMEAIAASPTAMDIVVANQTAWDTVFASQTALDAIADSRTAMDIVVANQTVMDDIASSNTALTSIFNSWVAREAIWDNETASDILMDTSNSNTWMRSNVAASTNVYQSSSYTLKVDKKVFVLQSQATAGGGYSFGGGYRYIQPGDGTYYNGNQHNVARTDRVQPLELRTESGGYQNRETVTYVQMQQ